MKTVFSNHEVPHLWAHQTQEHGRSNNISFKGPTIFSYGAAIAKHATNKRGSKAILYNCRHYSVTTSCHQSRIRSAIPKDALVLHVEGDVSRDTETLLQEHREEVRSASMDLANAKNATSRAKRYKELLHRIERLNTFAEFFGYKERVKLPKETEATEEAKAYLKKHEAAEKRKAAGLARKREAEQRQWMADNAQRIEDWRAGRQGWFSGIGSLPVMLRIVDGETEEDGSASGRIVESSQGASFPLRHAQLAAKILRPLLASGGEWHRNGQEIRLGHFHVDALDAGGDIRAGCHVVAKEEIERFLFLPEMQ